MTQSNKHTTLIISLIALGVFSRFLPHPPNATAIGAVAIFGGFALQRIGLSMIVLFASLFISDLALNNIVYASYYDGFQLLTPGFIYMYLGFAISIFAGRWVKTNYTYARIAGASIVSVTAFFLLSNFGAWLANPMYPQNISGLIASYVAGLPFALNQFTFTALYAVVLFGAYGVFTKKYPTFA